MTTNSSVAVELGARSYPVHIGAGLLAEVADCVPVSLKGKRLFILTDANARPYADIVKAGVEKAGAESAFILAVPPGEGSKSMHWYETVLGWMLDHGVTRQSILFAVGGGVIGDLGGFAAATVLRGIDFVQVPTTLLAMVDSAVGGKTAIDMPQGKNVVGAFHQPLGVVADTDVLRSLPVRQMRAGYAEAVKHGVMGDAAFFAWLEQNGRDVLALRPEALAAFVAQNCRIKAAIVGEDEKESGRRALLNLGHTFGHALEVSCGYSEELLHGEAVAAGMMMALDLSMRLGYASQDDCRRVEAHLRDVGLPTGAGHLKNILTHDAAGLVQLMYADKKAEAGRLNFVLVKKIGESFVARGVAEQEALAVVQDALGGGS